MTTTAAVPGSGRTLAGRHVRVAVVGAGFGGLAVAHGLRAAGVEDFVVLEKGDTVGGTWRENVYPGCGCDIPSNLYSFSFAPNPNWTRSFSRQPEILRYLQDVVRRFDLDRHIHLGVAALSAEWEDGPARWRLRTSAGELTADVLVGAGGPLTEPSVPDLPGLDAFPGPVVHSARWPEGLDLTGKRVAVVGTGASSIQLVPALQPDVARLVLFQRTPPWVIPKSDRPITAAERALYARVPAAQRAVRAFQYSWREAGVPGFTRMPALMKGMETVSRTHLRRSVTDPELRARLTPRYRIGCKRILPSNEYYPALTQPNVEVVAAALQRVEGGTAVAADGSRHEVDAIVLGTGFEIWDLPMGRWVRGRDGRTLAETWLAEGRTALRSTAVVGFPNLFIVLGPNSGLGHNSMVYIIESQAAYIVDAVRAMNANRLAAVEAKPADRDRWTASVGRRMRRTVWQTGGCVSWYQDPDGANTTLWPDWTWRFRRRTRGVDLREYEGRLIGPEIETARRAPVPAGGDR